MMPVGAGGGGFLRGRPAKPPSSRGSPPPGPARGRAGGRGRKWPGGRARPRRPPGGQVGAAPGLSARAGRGTGAQGRGSAAGAAARIATGPPPPAPPPPRLGPSCRPSEAGAAREGKPVPAGGPTGVSFGARSLSGSRGAPVTPACHSLGSRSERAVWTPRVAFPRPAPRGSPQPFPGWEIVLYLGIYAGDGRGGPSWEPLARGSGAGAFAFPGLRSL